MSRNGQVMVPGRIEIGCDYKYNPVMAQPAHMTTQTAVGATMHVFGGYTKLEDMAARIACAMIEKGSIASSAIGEESVKIAKDILEHAVAIDKQRGAPREAEPTGQPVDEAS